ncbi:MAG: hypothetical protein RLZZ414_1071 [Bacteroidota bacterium]|jgi:hypothetical protein
MVLTKKSMKTILTQKIKTVGKKTARTYLELTLCNYIHISLLCKLDLPSNYIYHEKENRLFFISPATKEATEIIKVIHNKKAIFKAS